jgi:hypothetical protein
MSYIIKSTSPFVSIKLTQKGREQLAQGKLNFNYWAIGDSEINYNREAIVDANPTDVTLSATSAVFRPFDRQPNIKTFITPNGASDPFQAVNGSVLNVVKAIVNNEADERGFFQHSGSTFTTLTGSTYTPYFTNVSNTVFTGGTTFAITTTDVYVGDIMLIKLANDTIGNIVNNENGRALPNLWFKVQATGAGYVTVDRNLPNLSAQTASSQVIFYRGGEVYDTISTGTTTAYWDSGTLSFDSNVNITCHDVPVWNMNNVWCEDIAGVTGLSTTNLYENYTKFGSYRYLGTKNPYLEYLCQSTGETLTFNCNGPGMSYPDEVVKSISIIHYTNNTISNLYGEFFYTEAVSGKYLSLYMPDLMYHRYSGTTGSGTSMGMTFIATGTTQVIPNSDIEYIDLIEDPTLIAAASTPKVIGRIYPQLKTCVIHDDEIVAATSYKSNRNWTLPELAATLQAPTGGTSTGVLAINDTMYLTYILENTTGTGLTTSMSCQEYIKITNNTSAAKDVAFRINETDLLPYMRKLESGYDGYGFYADKFTLVYQMVQDPTDRPDPGAWKAFDFTSTAITGGAGETIDPKLLEGQTPTTTGFIIDKLKDNSATTFSIIAALNMPANTQPEQLQFGDERFFYGNLTTFIGATIYKTIFDIRVNASQFNATTNPTRSKDMSTNPPNIKISEVGIYDTDRNLVCIGKLSNPVPLSGGNTIMLELSMDF